MSMYILSTQHNIRKKYSRENGIWRRKDMRREMERNEGEKIKRRRKKKQTQNKKQKGEERHHG